MRGKDQYEIEKDQSGKTSVKKLGVGAKQRDGFEYEFTCTFLIDQKTSMSEAQKDNTHLFENEGTVLLSETHGKKLIQWANSGEAEYTPTTRSNESRQTKEETIVDVRKKVASEAQSKAKISPETKVQVKEILAKYHPSGNPNKIEDIEQAKLCLEEINNIGGNNNE